MKKLLMLGTSMSSSDMVDTARQMGCYTIVTDNLPPEQSRAKLDADEYWMIDTKDIDALEEKCREEKIDAVFAGVSEFNLDRVKELTKRLNLPCYIEDEPWKYARNKHAFKRKCREIGIPTVEEYVLSDPPQKEEMEGIQYPVVVKPTDGTGNKGLSICSNDEELTEGCRKARSACENNDIIVERYITGEESWNIYYVAENEFRPGCRARAFKQPGYPSFLYSLIITAMEDSREYKEQLDEKCVELFRSIGCTKGMAWIQMIRDNEGNYYALEMAQRLSAGTSSFVEKQAKGLNSIKWLLDTALGIEHTASMLPVLAEPPYEIAYCACFLFAERAGIVSHIEFDKLEKDRFHVSPLVTEGDKVAAYRLIARIAFCVHSADELCDTLRYINENVKILDDQGENMYIQYSDYDTLYERNKGLFLSSQEVGN